MKTKGYVLMISIFLFSFVDSFGQAFQRAESMTISPGQVMPDQFTVIRLYEKPVSVKNLNRFDHANPYTYMEMLVDSRQKKYQVIYQTDFLGTLQYLSVSNNLAPALYKKDKPLFKFQYCMKGLKDPISPLELGDRIMECILNQLNDEGVY